MVVYNAASKELTAKIVYYGPGFGGKTTNLQFLHRRLEPTSVGNLLTLAATADRTIFFDLLPVELGDLKGYRIRFQVATVPGQSPYNETRRVVLRGADGIVFVVDSRWSQLPKNLESLQNLRENLKEESIDPASIPFAVQFNKRDLPDVLAVDALQEGLGLGGHPFIEAVASEGKGVVETFKLISKLTFVDILRRLQKRTAARPARAATVETENLSAWKTSMVHAAGGFEGESGPRPVAVPAPVAFPDDEDMSATRAIPVLRPHSVPAPAPAPPSPIAAIGAVDTPHRPASELASQPISISPFPIEDAEEAPSAPAAARTQTTDAIVFETFAPFPETGSGITENTNPAFYEHPPLPAAPPEPASTASFAAPVPPASELETTAPMTFSEFSRELEPLPATEAEPEPPSSAPAATSTSPEAPLSRAEERMDRMIQLAIASTWGDRVSAAEERLARAEEILAALPPASEKEAIEQRIASLEALPASIAAVEGRLGRAESARGWEKDVNALRTESANARLAAEGHLGDLRDAVADIRQNLAEASGREMELVAQVSRESLGVAAALEKLEFRIRDTEEKFNQLVVDQESRLTRLERHLEEQSARAAADREAHGRRVAELEEGLRASRDAAEDRIRIEREESAARHREEMKRSLGDALADLASRLRGDRPPE